MFWLWALFSLALQWPWLTLIVLASVVVFLNRTSIGVFDDPIRRWGRRRREGQLRRLVLENTHNDNARLELAQLLNDRGAFEDAMLMLRPALDRGETRVEAVFTMGAACLGAGYGSQGYQLLAQVPATFRMGEVDLVLGRSQLAQKSFAEAKSSFERFVQQRRGSVQGRVLLAQACDGLGQRSEAANHRAAAWHEYETSPRYVQRVERRWAWRIKPHRPAFFAVLAASAMAGLVWLAAQTPTTSYAPSVSTMPDQPGGWTRYQIPPLDDATLDRFFALSEQRQQAAQVLFEKGLAALPEVQHEQAELAKGNGFIPKEAENLSMVLISYYLVRRVDAERADRDFENAYGRESLEVARRHEKQFEPVLVSADKTRDRIFK